MTPYFYKIKHIPSGKIYVGSQYGKKSDPSKLWVEYFTSSKHIKQLIESDGKDSFELIDIKTRNDAREYEQKYLLRVYYSLGRDKFLDMFLNRNLSPGILLTKDMIDKANEKHNNKYIYSKVDYINNKKQIIIICKKHGEFLQQPYVHLLSHGCPSCINKTEFNFFERIKQIYPLIKRQYKVEWCKNKLHLPYDFAIEEYKIIIELDGEQHFKQISNWTSPEIQFEKDKYKMKCANENGFSVIRLPQFDILKDNFDWIIEIQTSISKIISEKKVQNIFICKNNEYINYI